MGAEPRPSAGSSASFLESSLVCIPENTKVPQHTEQSSGARWWGQPGESRDHKKKKSEF